MLHVNGLTKSFGFGSDKLQVLKGIDLELKKGELVALMGPSGCGKSTLLNIIGGLLPGDGGEIDLNGRKYVDWKNFESHLKRYNTSNGCWCFNANFMGI